ncbi:uncharacterized protein A1O9_09518 [Exophiala aquamarina CBS 119918]|uniref:Flavin reductase like domain-containing protein n=1 Tax=Exophiala aquamarina CBS 119918 TaxID=1182545 RepID=A0A072P3S8_9EURO|nr:uncharacterized protein A1O9_09518 [Exophiala aquamarina CBS 119918]KEF54352.1 hypothetical protein A1O9_09518 [Exophiala aquamarina CBS 119918]
MATVWASTKLAGIRSGVCNATQFRGFSIRNAQVERAYGARKLQILCRRNSSPNRNSRCHGGRRNGIQYDGITSPGFPASTALRSQHTAALPATDLDGSNNDPEVLSHAVKQLMRHVPHPVAVITATDISMSSEGGPQGWRGATVSSFNTVTLFPTPVVSFNIRKISSTFAAMRSSGLFNVHLLSEATEATDIASKFATGNASSPFHDEEGEIESFAHLTDPVRTALSSKLPPILQSRDGMGRSMVPFRLHCRFMGDKVVEIGDHVVLFGEVVQIFHDDNTFHDQPAILPKPCLVYVNGRYTRVDSHFHVTPFVQRRKITTISTCMSASGRVITSKAITSG